GGGQVVGGLVRQQVAVVAEGVLTEVSEQLRAARGGQQQARTAAAVVIGPDAGTTAAHAGQRRFAERIAAGLQQDSPAAADQAEVGLAVAVEVHRGNRLGLRVHTRERRIVRETRQAVDPAEVLAAPADEVTLLVVVAQLEAGLEALNLGFAKV